MKSSWIVLLFVSIAPIAWSRDKDRKSPPAATQEAKPAWHSQLQSLS